MLVARGNDSRLRISAWIFDDRSGYADADPTALVRQFIDQQAPDLMNKTERWQSGVSTYTSDSAPLVGQLPVDGRVFYATAAGLRPRMGPHRRRTNRRDGEPQLKIVFVFFVSLVEKPRQRAITPNAIPPLQAHLARLHPLPTLADGPRAARNRQHP